MPSILCLTGWGQEYKSLEPSFNSEITNNFEISSFNYFANKSFQEVISSLEKSLSKSSLNQNLGLEHLQSTQLSPNRLNQSQLSPAQLNPDIVVGWSLGGQIAIRLIEAQILNPKLLVLIAPPFQLVKDSRVYAGMSSKTFDDFYFNFTTNPDLTLKKFAILSLMNDKNKAQIIKNIKIDELNSSNLSLWLQELKNFSCFNVDFSHMPETLFYAGRGDMIVHLSQVKYFEERIRNLDLHCFDNCGHAPHLSDKNLFNKILLEKIKSLKI